MSQDLNSVFIIGRLTRDAEAKGEAGPVRFSIAVNRRVKKGEEWLDEASFFDVEYWHRGILAHLVKGKQVALTGELKQDRWTDGEGAARSKVVISAQNIQLLGGGAQDKPAQQATKQAPSDDGFKEDIPW